MKFLSYSKDGGTYSTVSGLFIIEIKKLFSIVLLRFEDGSRDAFHSHAFNCFSWLLSGRLYEQNLNGSVRYYKPSLFPFTTKRTTFHKVKSNGISFVLSFRGPWAKTWQEYLPIEERFVELTNGRKEGIIESTNSL